MQLGGGEGVGEHPGFAVVDTALVERGGHERQPGQRFGEVSSRAALLSDQVKAAAILDACPVTRG